MICGALLVYGGLTKTVSKMEKEIIEMKKDQKDLTKTLAQIAVQNMRLDHIEEDIRDLRHGRGYIIEKTS
jgi:hypothetical protein